MPPASRATSPNLTGEAKRLLRPAAQWRHTALSAERPPTPGSHPDRARLGFTLAEIGDLLARPDGKRLHLTQQQCVAQINRLEQQKRGIEIALAELRQIYNLFYRKLLDAAVEDSR
jgi:hypothetical protein